MPPEAVEQRKRDLNQVAGGLNARGAIRVIGVICVRSCGPGAVPHSMPGVASGVALSLTRVSRERLAQLVEAGIPPQLLERGLHDVVAQ